MRLEGRGAGVSIMCCVIGGGAGCGLWCNGAVGFASSTWNVFKFGTFSTSLELLRVLLWDKLDTYLI